MERLLVDLGVDLVALICVIIAYRKIKTAWVYKEKYYASKTECGRLEKQYEKVHSIAKDAIAYSGKLKDRHFEMVSGFLKARRLLTKEVHELQIIRDTQQDIIKSLHATIKEKNEAIDTLLGRDEPVILAMLDTGKVQAMKTFSEAVKELAR